MKVLMFGWEFPPIASGGLGTACYGLTKGLKNNNVEVLFVMPSVSAAVKHPHVDLVSANDVTVKDTKGNVSEFIDEVIPVNCILTPYMTSKQYLEKKHTISSAEAHEIQFGYSNSKDTIYGKNLYQEVWRYRQKAKMIARAKKFDLIHCHDWMTYGAGIEAKKISGKPLVVHIHATEFDRTGDNPNQYVYQLEKEGFENADKIIAVSNYTKSRVVNHYGINPEKIEVVHNAVETKPTITCHHNNKLGKEDKIVLFLGRVTIQKGPDWFIYTAKKVLNFHPNTKFVIAGSGDMEPFIIHKVAELGIADKVLFTGFLQGEDIDRAYRMADLYVLPSVSEPFGITPLESMRNGTPVLISRQSGVSEVVNNCLKADFWDIDEMTNKIVGVLNYSALHDELSEQGIKEVQKFNWDIPASKCVNVYNHVMLFKQYEGLLKW